MYPSYISPFLPCRQGCSPAPGLGRPTLAARGDRAGWRREGLVSIDQLAEVNKDAGAGPEVYRIGTPAEGLGELLGKPVKFAGWESDSPLIGNRTKLRAVLGQPTTTLETMLRWTADRVRRGGRSLGKPTHFEARDGEVPASQ